MYFILVDFFTTLLATLAGLEPAVTAFDMTLNNFPTKISCCCKRRNILNSRSRRTLAEGLFSNNKGSTVSIKISQINATQRKSRYSQKADRESYPNHMQYNTNKLDSCITAQIPNQKRTNRAYNICSSLAFQVLQLHHYRTFNLTHISTFNIPLQLCRPVSRTSLFPTTRTISLPRIQTLLNLRMYQRTNKKGIKV